MYPVLSNCDIQASRATAATEREQTTDTPAATEAALLTKLETRHYCDKCQAACFIMANGDHYVYTMTDKSTWVHLMVSLVVTVLLPTLTLYFRL